MADQRVMGVTGPMSMDPPSPRDLKLNDALMDELKAQRQFETPEETQRRVQVLEKLGGLLRQLVLMIGRQRGLPQSVIDVAGGKVFTYGSYRLGVYGPGSDIDTLMVAPKHVTRDQFFEHMPDLLRKSFKPEDITELTPVPGIAVPIIKLEVCKVNIDLIFCSLPVTSVPANMELNDINLLRGLDDTDLKCVNGTRVTDRILTLVPQSKTFRQTLRAVKLWAKQRALYGNIVGYPGGVAYAIMVARVCQLYPKAAPPFILWKFFRIIRSWPWPSPVLLQEYETAPFQLREWDPQVSYGDRSHLMPVITPAYPRANSTHTIGPSTKLVLLQEFERAELIVKDIYEGKRPWKDLFQRHSFFTDSYKHYISVITAGKTRDAIQAWSGLVESKVKWLIAGIERSDATSVELVQPFNKGFVRTHECKSAEDEEKTLNGDLSCQVQETTTMDGTADVKAQAAAQAETDGKEAPDLNGSATASDDFPRKVWTTSFYVGIGLKKGANALDISEPIKQFKQNCLDWPGYNADLHSIQIKHIRNFNLPTDVFKPGEARPTKKIKTKTPMASAPKGADAANNKRSFADTGLDVGAANGQEAKRNASRPIPSIS